MENGFLSFVYPAQYVAEPPLAHLYLALLWSLFGKSLLVAHLSITVFSLGVIWQVYRLCERLETKYTPYIFLLVLLEPALSTQMILISPDVITCFFALLSVNLLLENKRSWLALSVLCLGLVSIRGFVVCSGLGLAYLVILIAIDKKSFKEAFLYVFPSFVPVLLVLGAWFLYRKWDTGYFMYQPGFEYQEHRELASLSYMIRNIASLAIRMFDSGRIIVWILLFVAVLKIGIKNFFSFIVRSPLSIIYLSVLLTMSLVTIPMTNPFGDRYFIVLYILLALVTARLLSEAYGGTKIRVIFIGMILVLVSGNFWVYSEKRSKAWDSVLCHFSYYPLRQEMITYLDEQGISVNDVSASFPLDSSFSDTEANEDNRRFSSVDFDKSQYIIYSNIYNWDDEYIDALCMDWKLQKEFKYGLIYIRLYVP